MAYLIRQTILITAALVVGIFYSSLSFATTEVVILSANTEFFFDHEVPHGSVVSNDLPTEQEWKAKAQRIADLINNSEANIVGLVEIENERVVEEVRTRLNDSASWVLVFVQGRDHTTGQDVALLTRFEVVDDSETNFPDERDIIFDGIEEKTVNPSKVLAVTLTIENQPTRIILTHLISRRGNNDAKRFSQATVIRRHAVMAMIRGENVIVLGTSTMNLARQFSGD